MKKVRFDDNINIFIKNLALTKKEKNKLRKNFREKGIVRVDQLRSLISTPRVTSLQTKNKKLIHLISKKQRQFFKNSDQFMVKKIHNYSKMDNGINGKILSEINKIKFPKTMNLKTSLPTVEFGLSKGKRKKIQTLTSINTKKINFPQDFILPDYHTVMPTISDQGYRGTCVGHAAENYLNYVHPFDGKRSYSPQWLFFQCKCIDGIPNSDGTYMYAIHDILSREELVDIGCPINYDLWPYNPKESDTVHQGPPPEKCFKTKRIILSDSMTVRESSKIYDLKYILEHLNIPIMIGVRVYDIDFSEFSIDYGVWPIPSSDDLELGGHAMCVVGWMEWEGLEYFILRNSWGPEYAYKSPFQSGHVLIPTWRLENEDIGAICFQEKEIKKMKIKNIDRLYHKIMKPKLVV